MSNQFELLSPSEIVSVADSSRILLAHPTFKVNELAKAIIEMVKTNDTISSKAKEQVVKWCGEGVECEALKIDGKGWRKGKVRLALEFCPEQPEVEEIPQTNGIVEPESPLDDLREMVN